MDHAPIDVVIVTRDTRQLVLECLDHLGTDGIAHAVVVDNGSGDGTAGAVRTAHPTVEVVELDRPTGFAAANNIGWRRGSAPLVLFLNSDVFAVEGSISLLAEALRSRPQANTAAGRLVDMDGISTQRRYGPRRFMALDWFVADLTGLNRAWPGNPVNRRYVEPVDGAHVREVGHVAGACMLVRREALEGVGGFDEQFWFWYEDVDLGRRLSRLGSALYVPRATFRHVGGASFGRWPRPATIRSRFHGILRYGNAHLSRRERVGLALTVIAVATPRMIVYSAIRPAEARAYRDVIGAAMRLLRDRPLPWLAPGEDDRRSAPAP